MISFRNEKLKSAIIRLSAEFLNREASKQSLITVTDCEFVGDNQACTIIVSVFPPDQGKTALAFLKRKRIELRDYLRANLRAGRLPRVDFTLASGDKW